VVKKKSKYRAQVKARAGGEKKSKYRAQVKARAGGEKNPSTGDA
jgi:hypothetical protein